MEKKKILILGGTGFIGTHLANMCLKKNYETYVLSRNVPKIKAKNVIYINCDISKKTKIYTKLKKYIFDYIVNCAGNIDHSNNTETYKTHYQGCKNIIEFFKKKKFKKFIQIGSCLEYGSKKSPHREDLFIKNEDLKSPYAISKLNSTKYLVNLFKKYKLPITILRLYQIYGPGQKYNRLIPYVIKSCLSNLSFKCSNGLQKKDFLYIDDLIRFIFIIIKSKNTDGKIINVGQGKSTKVKNIILFIRNKINSGKPLFGKVKIRKDESKDLFPEISIAKHVFKFTPKVTLKKGLEKTIRYYKNLHTL